MKKQIQSIIFSLILFIEFAYAYPVNAETSPGTSSDTSEAFPLHHSSEEAIIESSHDVIIVGAGIAGLTAAYFLRDYNVKLLEKNNRVGGRAISGTYQGFSYAKGVEYLGEADRALRKIIKSLNLQPKEIPSPMDAHFYNGKFYYGEEGLALMYIKQSSIEEYNRFVSTIQGYAEEYDDVPWFDLNSDLSELDDITAREWFDQNKFAKIYHESYNVAARGLFGASIDEISALSFIPETAFDYVDSEPLENVESLENASVQGKEETGAYTFITGITEITDAIAQHLGDTVQLSSKVTDVIKQNDKYLVTYTDEHGVPHRLASDIVILAVPSPIVLRLAPTVLSKKQKTIMEQIPYAPYITVTLFSQEPILNNVFDLAVPEGYFFTDVYDSTWVQRFYDKSLRNSKAGIMSVYIAPNSYKDTSILSMSNEEILKNVALQS